MLLASRMEISDVLCGSQYVGKLLKVSVIRAVFLLPIWYSAFGNPYDPAAFIEDDSEHRIIAGV